MKQKQPVLKIKKVDDHADDEARQESFFSVLENPSPPNEALKAAFKKHQEISTLKM